MSIPTNQDLTFVNISERAYKYIRQFTIKSVDDALVELITNCIDAYNQTDQQPRLIQIELVGQSVLKVRDNALGLTASDLVNCFLQVGNYTAGSSSRGFFSRGAKDISALGTVYFKTIKDNKYSACLLNTDAYGTVLVADQPVTPEIREQLKIPDQTNGLEVTLELLPNFCNLDFNNITKDLCTLAVLRDIMSDPKNNIIVYSYDSNNNLRASNRVTFTYPESNLILDLVYNIPNYTECQAHFKVYKTNNPLPQPTKENMMQFGFLIKDSVTIYEVNTIDSKYRWNPYINFLYGYLECDAIRSYLQDYDKNGPSAKNPYPIIDPSRLTGVNNQHPLIKNMYSIPLVRLDLILRELNNQIASQSITIEDIDDLLNELNKYGINIIESEDIPVNFVSNYDSNLVKAVEDDRNRFITYENSHPVAGNYSTDLVNTNNYINKQIKMMINRGPPGTYYLFTREQTVIPIENSSLYNDNIQEILKLIKTENQEDLNVHPYIYKIGPDDDLKQVYVFQKGTYENATNQNEQILIKNKQFSIQFINDLNLTHRYVIDNTNGIVIKLNLNNPVVSKYMTGGKKLGQLNNNIQLSNIKNTQSLMFFKELITDIIATIIVESDAANGKLILDSDQSNDTKKSNKYYNTIVNKIEGPINTILQKYINNNINRKNNKITSNLTSIQDQINQQITDPNIVANLNLLLQQVTASITNIVE